MKRPAVLAAGFVGLGVAAALLAWSVAGSPARVEPARVARPTASTTAEPALPAPAPRAAAQTPPGGIASFDCARPIGAAARVDGVTLQLADLCTRLSAFGAVMKGGTDRTQARRVLDRMIDATVVHNMLAQKRIVIDAKELGETTGILREQLRERLELAALVRMDPVTEADIDAELARGAPGVDRGEGIEVDGWLMRVAPNDSAGKAAAQQRMQELAKNPDAITVKQGVTPIPRFVVGTNSVEPALEAVAAALGEGKWSAPVQTRVGWAVIRVVRTVDGMELSDPKLRPRVRRALEARHRAEHEQTLEQLRAKARVEIFVDV